jgi:Icc-related predicted phosphoesterase
MKKILLILFLVVYGFAGYNHNILNQISEKNHNQNSFSFVVAGDNRDGDAILEKIIKQINQDRNISFMLNNGDLVACGYEKQFKNYISIIKTSKIPILSIIGNHEIPWYGGESNFKNYLGKTQFSFVFGNSYFIILDSAKKTIKHLKWLKKELQKSQKYTHRFVLFHVPLYDPRKGEYKKGHSLKSLKLAHKLNNLFDKYNVDMVFCSHIHFYYRGKWQNTPFIITGGAGAPLKKYKNYGVYNYVKVIVKKDNVEYKIVVLKGEKMGLFDRTIEYIKDFFDMD